MMFFYQIVVVLLVFTNYFCSQGFRVNERESRRLGKVCGKRPLYWKVVEPFLKFKIYKGREVQDGEFPMAVGLRRFIQEKRAWDQGICGGTLISRRHILTAAHCITQSQSNCKLIIDPSEIQAHVGSIILSSKSQKWLNIKNIIKHRRYDNSRTRVEDCTNVGGDIAILELEEEVSESLLDSGKVGFACLPKRDRKIDVKTKFAYGWGYDPDSDPMTPRKTIKMMTLRLFPMNRQTCLRRFQEKRRESPASDTICVWEGDSNVCQGDSGGPLLQSKPGNKERFEVVGVVSYGTLCDAIKESEWNDAEIRAGGIFTDVRLYLDWICEKTGICYTKVRWLW